MPQARTYVFLQVTGFGNDSTAVTAIMGVPPSRAWIEGDPVGPGGRRTYGAWIIDSGVSESEPLERHTEELITRLEPHAEALRRVAASYTAMIRVAQYFEGDHNPGFRLEAALLRRVARFEVPIDFDLYCLAGDESDRTDS
jgi:hypothetical protein